MGKLLNIITILFQLGLTFVSTFLIYMLYALFDYSGGFPNFIGMILFQPFVAIFFSVVTIVICSIVGLPIRLSLLIREWWQKHFYVALVLIALGTLACVSSLFFIEEVIISDGFGEDITKSVPNQVLFISGWFVFAFGTLHLFPPTFIQQKIVQLFNRV